MANNLPVGTKIKVIRRLRKMKQGELAKLIGIDRTQLSYIETGKVLPTEKRLIAIQAALRVDFDDPDIEAAFALLEEEGD